MRRGAQDEAHAAQLAREDDDPVFRVLMRHLKSRTRVRLVLEAVLLEGYEVVRRQPRPAQQSTPAVDLGRAVEALHARREQD